MSQASTIQLVRLYTETGPTPSYLTRQFQSPRQNYFSSKEVEIHVQRMGRPIAVTVKSLADDGTVNTLGQWTKKTFEPPIYKEITRIEAWEGLSQQPGQTPYGSVDFQANAYGVIRPTMAAMQQKILRSIELQAAQVLQTGTLTLPDESGAAAFTLDFSMKSTHKPTTGTSWAGSADPIGDVAALCRVIESDSGKRPRRATFGPTSWNYFLADATVALALNWRRANFANLSSTYDPATGGTYMGMFDFDGYDLECVVYDETYENYAGASTRYLAADKVLISCGPENLDLAYGYCPTFSAPGAVNLGLLPSRYGNPAAGTDMFMSAWVESGGDALVARVAARPLTIPTGIDTFGCLDTVP
jgi:hypothetical protein